MSLLTYNELRSLCETYAMVGYYDEERRLPIEQINGASIDLTLGDSMLIEDRPSIVDLSAKQRPQMREMRLEHGYWELRPGDFVLAHTAEYFRLPADVAGHVMLKSSLARAGLQHLFAGFADPTFEGVLTLELVNQTTSSLLRLRPGQPIGQMVFWRGEPVPIEQSYAMLGQYQGDRSVAESRGARLGSVDMPGYFGGTA